MARRGSAAVSISRPNWLPALYHRARDGVREKLGNLTGEEGENAVGPCLWEKACKRSALYARDGIPAFPGRW